METPVYVFTGLLESGKTTLIYEVAGEEDFLEPGTTVLVQCEEGEVPLSEEFLRKSSIVLLTAEEPEDLNEMLWKRIERDYQPTQVLVEYNGMWETEKLFDCGMPDLHHYQCGDGRHVYDQYEEDVHGAVESVESGHNQQMRRGYR